MNKMAKNLIIIVLGALCGYLIYYNVIMEVVSVMYGSGGKMYYIISIVLLFLSILCCCLIIAFIFNRQIDRRLFILISICLFFIFIFRIILPHGHFKRIHFKSLRFYKSFKQLENVFSDILKFGHVCSFRLLHVENKFN